MGANGLGVQSVQGDFLMFSYFEVVCDSREFIKNASDSHEAYDYVDEHESSNPGHKCKLQSRGIKTSGVAQ